MTTFYVSTPWEPTPRRFSFPPEESVGSAAGKVTVAFERPGNRPSFQRADGVVLDRSATLSEVGVTEGETLELNDVGGSV